MKNKRGEVLTAVILISIVILFTFVAQKYLHIKNTHDAVMRCEPETVTVVEYVEIPDHSYVESAVKSLTESLLSCRTANASMVKAVVGYKKEADKCTSSLADIDKALAEGKKKNIKRVRTKVPSKIENGELKLKTIGTKPPRNKKKRK